MEDSKFSINKIFKYLSKKRKRQLLLTFIVMILSGGTEFLVLNSIVPFLAAITNPQKISDFRIARLFSNLLNIPLNGDSVYPFVLLFATSVLLSCLFRLLSTWLKLKITALLGSDLSIKTFSKSISQPYEYYLNNNSSTLIATNILFVNNTLGVCTSYLNLVYTLILTTAISIGIIFISPILSFTAVFFLATIYLCLGKGFKKKLRSNSKKRVLIEKSIIKSLQEGFGSIRNIILDSNHKIYIEKIKKLDWNKREIDKKNGLIFEIPRFVIEALVLLFIALACTILFRNVENNSTVIVTIGAFTLGMQKLILEFQKIYRIINQIRASSSDLDNILKTFEMKDANKIDENISPLKLKNSIRFDSIYFSYNKKTYVISDLNLEIFKGQRIGIIGKTGSGKTTISDLLMGLLKPTKGKIYIDEKDIHDKNYPNRLIKWRSSISHVPQNIFLTEASIAENIAFGLEKKLISMKKVKECAKKAQIHEFIESTNNGYLTDVGERGIRLSGGQLQRIAIARALYKKSDILIFDEATSALDNNTETELMRAINDLSDELTIISIAHRHTTLKNYDRIIKVEKESIFEVDKDRLFL